MPTCSRVAGKVDRPLSPKAVRNVHGVVHRSLRDAVRWDLVARNVAESADPPRVAAPTVTAWTAENAAVLLDATADDRLGPLWVLLAETGMRRGEALALRWSDVDLAARTANVVRTASLVGKRDVHGTEDAGQSSHGPTRRGDCFGSARRSETSG